MATAPLPRPHRNRRRLWLALPAVLVPATLLLGIALATRDSGGKPPAKPPPPAVAPIQPGATPQDQARNLSAWLRRYSG
jgi:hypothetical protein